MSSFLMDILYITLMSSVVIAAVLLIKTAFKNKLSAGVLSALWIIVLLRLILPVTFNSPVHIGDFIPEKESAPIEHTETVESNTTVNEYMPTDDFSYYENENTIHEHNTTNTVPNTSPVIEEEKVSTFAKILDFISAIKIETAAFTLWIAVGLVIMLKCVISLFVFSTKLKTDSTVSAKLYSAFCDAKSIIKTKGVRIIESTIVDMPIAYGLMSPKVVIPKSMAETLDEDKLRLIILHELMHIKRMDILKNYLWLLAKAVHWFNPLVWIAYRQYTSDAEIICDTKVMELLDADTREEYGRSLIEATKLLSSKYSAISPIMLSFCEDTCKLRRRIMNVIKPTKQSKKQIFIISMVILTLVISCFTTACQVPEDDANTTDSIEMPTPTYTPFPMGTDEDGNVIYATAYPEGMATPEPISEVTEDYTAEKTIIDSIINKEPIVPSYVPEYWLVEKDIGELNLKIEFDPEDILSVGIPNVDVLNTYELEWNQWDRDTAEKAVNYLMDETLYNDWLSDDDIQKEIDILKNELKNFTLSPEDQEYFDERLEDHDRRMSGYSDYEVSLDSVLEKFDDSPYLAIKSYDENNVKSQLIMESYDFDDQFYIFARTQYFRGDMLMGYGVYGIHNILETNYNTIAKDDAVFKALRHAEDAVSAMTDNMVLSNVFTSKKIHKELAYKYNIYDLYDQSDETCYIFEYVPAYEGVMSLAGQRAVGIKTLNEFYELQADTNTEYIRIFVDDTGIISLYWEKGYNEVSSQEYNNIISVEDAFEVFADYVYSDDIWTELPSRFAVINIEEVHLGMVYYNADGSLGDTTKMIPVYRVRADRNYFTDKDMGWMEEYEYKGHTLYINAIDGTIVEPTTASVSMN